MTVTVYRNLLREVLLKQGRRVEIWESSGRMNWKIAKQASPGNLQDIEDELGGQIDASPIIMAVRVQSKASEARTVGVCFADASVRELGVSEFLDNDVYSNFESLLIQLGARECLMQTNGLKKDPELSKLQAIIENCGIAVTERSAADFGTKDVEQDLTRLLKDERAFDMLPQAELKNALGSAAALIKYLGVLHDVSNMGQYQLFQHDLSQYMKLDASALKALNLMPTARDGAKSMSLYGLLNNCKTSGGSRLLGQWLKQPLMSCEEIERRQDLVEAFVNDTELRQMMQEEHLRSIPDLSRLSKRFQRKLANLEDVVRAYQVVIRLPGFVATLEAVIDEKYQTALEEAYTSKLRQASLNLSRLQEMVESTVDLDALDNHEFIIKSDFDDGLRIIRRRLEKIKYDMEVEHRRVAKDLDQDVDKKLFLENHRVHGWCLRLTRTEAGCIRNKKQYQECSTQKNGVYFTTSTLATMRREFDQLSSNYNRTQSGLVGEVVAVAASYTPVLEALAAVLSHLDVIVSFAHVSLHAPTPYVRPIMHPRGTGDTILTEARHPCLEVQDDVQFIANDVALVRGQSTFLIITGPNMGGKSTYIRQVGVIALLAQTGCFVPCATAELQLFDCILARVGASDSQLKGVSTFMAEMLETANILKTATAESLVIVDELGRGTSTYDGFGLAWAISEELVTRIGACALFATHFHELTALAAAHPQVQNLNVLAHIGDASDDGTGADVGGGGSGRREVVLLYKVEPGVCQKSFGIHVAELVRFPEKVVRMARWRADELEDFSVAGGAGAGDVRMSDDADADGTEGNGAVGSSSSSHGEYSAEEVEQGSRLLKEVLVRWKDEVGAAGGMSAREKRERMRAMVAEKEGLRENKYFRSIRAL